ITGTADDVTLTAYNLDAAHLALSPVQVYENNPALNNDFYTWEFTANRRQVGRWSVLASVAETFNRSLTLASGVQFSPNQLINTVSGKNNTKTWNGKVSGTIDAMWGLRFLPSVRYQAGTPYAQTFTARLNY